MAMETNVYDEIAVWEKKCEDLIAVAMNEGADDAIRNARLPMFEGRIYEDPMFFQMAQSALQEGIAAVRREKDRRASRRSLVIKLKSLFGLHVGS